MNRKAVKRLAKDRLPRFAWNALLRIRASAVHAFRWSLERAGYVVARRDDYYSPLMPVSRLEAKLARWNRPSALPGVAFDVNTMERDLSGLLSRYRDEIAALPTFDHVRSAGFGEGYNALDALVLYMQIRDLKPARYLEVGSGMSTYYCHLAAERNALEGHPVEITCVEPFPYDKLRTIPRIRVIANEVQDVDLSLFEHLEENDVLFIDSTHVLKIDGDVPFLYLEVLPRLKPGVVIHIHDIPFPYNVPHPAEHWVFGHLWPLLWNEAMVLQAFLAFNDKFRITMSMPLIQHFDESFLRSNLPGYRPPAKNRDTFSSIWLRRVG